MEWSRPGGTVRRPAGRSPRLPARAGAALLLVLLAAGTANAAPGDDLPRRAEAALELARRWLFGNLEEDSLFLYLYDPSTGEGQDRNNAVRQLMASRLLALAARQDPGFRPLHARNLAAILDRWYRRKGGEGYIFLDGNSKLGANAMALRTLVASPEFRTHLGEAAALAAGIRAIQAPEGSFAAWYMAPDRGEYDEDYYLKFYSGEAILALLEYHDATGDTAALAAAERAAGWYLREYVEEIDANYYPAYVPWITMAFARLYDLGGEPKYARAVGIMNDRLLALQDSTVYVGRFYNPRLRRYGKPHAASDGIYTEGLAWACEVARKSGDRARLARYREALVRGVENLLSLQYREPVPAWTAPPERYVGALRTTVLNPSIRVDNTQHAIDALEKAIEVLQKR